MSSSLHKKTIDPVLRLHAAPEPQVMTFDLVASPEPAVVFASLLTICVPRVCDSLLLEITDGPVSYCVTNPHVPASGPPTGARHQIEVRFASGGVDDDDPAPFCGVAVFGWRSRVPSQSHQRLGTTLVDNAVQTVRWQRSERRARAAEALTGNLRIALGTSRIIGMAVGILMSLHKITDEQGFELLSRASQNSNRKLRDIAAEVVETGWLDQPAQPTSRPVTTRGHKTPPPAGGGAREFPAAPRGAAGNLAGAEGTVSKTSEVSWHVADRQLQLRGTTS